MRRAIEYKLENGETEAVHELATKAAAFGAGTGILIAAGPTLQGMMVGMGGPIGNVAGAAAGPFTTHFWAPMSKWAISGASFLDLQRQAFTLTLSYLYKTIDETLPFSLALVSFRPTDKVSLPQYTALTLTGLFFSRYALLVAPINYTLCSVNIALFGSSAWHLGRKVKADFIDDKKE